MQHNNSSPSTYNASATLAPAQDKPARSGKPTRFARLFKATRRVILGDKHIRQLPIGHPDALVDRPGERRIVFGNNVLIIRKPAKD